MPRLAAALAGKMSPADQVERTRLVSRACEKSLRAAFTRLAYARAWLYRRLNPAGDTSA